MFPWLRAFFWLLSRLFCLEMLPLISLCPCFPLSMPVQRHEKYGFFSCCRDGELEMVLGRHVEVRNVMPGGLGGHLGKVHCELRRRDFLVSQRQTPQEETGTRLLLLLSGKGVATWLVVGAYALFWRVELGAVARSGVGGVTRFFALNRVATDL